MPRPRYKIELPASLDSAYTPPEDASVEELTALVAQAREDGTKLLDDPKAGAPAERVAKATWLSKAIESIESRQDELVQSSEAEKASLEAARAALTPKASDAEGDPEGEGEGDDDEEGEGEGEGQHAKDAQAAAQAGAPAATTAGDPGSAPAGEQLLVAGAGSRRSAVAAAASAGGNKPAARRPVPKGEGAYLLAGAGSNDYQTGERVDFEGMGRIAVQRFDALQGIGEGGPRVQTSMGRIKIPTADQRLVASASGRSEFADVREQIEWAISMERLLAETGADSLVAAGGWCAPSETLYDLVNLMTRDGLLDVPGITVTRGGVRYSLGPDYTAVYNAGINFTKTEAQAIAGSAKPVVNIPCPSFTDNRMNVDGMYLTGDILSQKGYPEAYADFLEKATIAFAHYQNAAKIADQVTGSTLIDYTAGTPPKGLSISVTSTLLGTLELQITDMRYKNRLSLTQMVEVVLPEFAKGILRSDMAKRLGVENGQGITDADIEGFIALRGGRVQWVYDWQDAFTGVSGGFGAATAPFTWPTTINYLLYPQGTWVVAESDVIELQAVYDSTLLTTNQFVALFMERGRLSLKRAWDSRNVKIPVVVSGSTALGVDYSLTANQPTV